MGGRTAILNQGNLDSLTTAPHEVSIPVCQLILVSRITKPGQGRGFSKSGAN